MRTRVLLADDHKLMVEAFAKLLEADYDVVGTVFDGKRVVEEAIRLDPDVVVADIDMPELDGIDACRRLRQRLPETPVVLVTMHGEPDVAAEALRAGALGFVRKTDGVTQLRAAIEAAVRGEQFVSPSVDPDRLARALASTPVKARLTPRQRDVLRLLAQGLAMKQVARELDITPRTVAFHKYRIMERHGIDSSAGLVKLAIDEGLLRS